MRSRAALLWKEWREIRWFLIVGAAILVGIKKFDASHQEASVEALKLDLLTIAAKAQLYCHTPKSLDGSDHSFS